MPQEFTLPKKRRSSFVTPCYVRRSICHRRVTVARLGPLILLWMVHEDEFSASMLLLPPSDTVAFWSCRLSRIGPVAHRPSLLFVSEESISVYADAVSWAYEVETIA
jgi:hypothetical protein